MDPAITVRGARANNLKGIDLDIPKGEIVAFTGPSGSGKSSLVFDTLYAESQRQLVETFSAFSRRFLPQFSKPSVDSLRGLGTAVLIDQKPMGRTLRSTVGTATEINTYLRMAFSRFGEPQVGPSFFFSFNNPQGMCPDCSGLGQKVEVDLDLLVDRRLSLREGAIAHSDYKVGGWKWRELEAGGLFDLDKVLGDYSPEEWRLLLFTEPVALRNREAKGVYSRTHEGIARKLLAARLAKGEAEEADKGAYSRYFRYGTCPRCGGTRLNEKARSARLGGLTISEVCDLELVGLSDWLSRVAAPGRESLIGKMGELATNLIEGGAGYLSLSRPVASLSGGEAQRVKMARQLDCGLSDLVYIVDEPTTGLHPSDNDRLWALLEGLRRRGNTLLLVEHDPDILSRAAWIAEIGPGAGSGGGNLVYAGPSTSWPGLGPRPALPGQRRRWTESFQVRGARTNNLRGIDVDIPKGVLTCVTGVSGSGKSSLILEDFFRLVPQAVVIDQGAIGATSRGNAATYTGVFDLMRKELAPKMGVEPGLLSFNSAGACPECRGAGAIRVDLSFLDDLVVSCESCGGSRYRPEALAATYQGKTIADLLELTALEAADYFESPELRRRLSLLSRVGLGYLHLGQGLDTLSGGERQRLKLAAELHKSGEVYILDEPTTGLHQRDVEVLARLLHELVDSGNTVLVIEHNLQLMAQADWIIDLGPGGGREGGLVVAQGGPEEVAAAGIGLTARHLAAYLGIGDVPGTRAG